jgi:hypothetical protein
MSIVRCKAWGIEVACRVTFVRVGFSAYRLVERRRSIDQELGRCAVATLRWRRRWTVAAGAAPITGRKFEIIPIAEVKPVVECRTSQDMYHGR